VNPHPGENREDQQEQIICCCCISIQILDFEFPKILFITIKIIRKKHFISIIKFLFEQLIFTQFITNQMRRIQLGFHY